MGQNAESAVPELTNLLLEDPDNFFEVLVTLYKIDPDAVKTIDSERFTKAFLRSSGRLKDAQVVTRELDDNWNTVKANLDYKEITKPIAPENAIGRISRMDAINNKSVTEAALRQAK